MGECYCCGFWNSDYEACTCPSQDKWYACPIESKKPENQKALEEYAEWAYCRGQQNDNDDDVPDINAGNKGG